MWSGIRTACMHRAWDRGSWRWQGACSCSTRMSLPRPVYPGSTLMGTRRCTERQFLLRPDPETNNAVMYCLAVAAQRCEVDVIDFVQMSNHLHEAIFDRRGNAPAFYEHFHKLLAKCMNARVADGRISSRASRSASYGWRRRTTSSTSWSTSRAT